MTSDNYKLALMQAHVELAQTVQERDRLNLEIVRLQSLVKGLAMTAHHSERAEKFADAMQNKIGLTQTIETIVNQSADWVSPLQVREQLRASGYDIDKYKNPMAAIHQSLIRLATDGRVQCMNGQYKRSFWQEQVTRALGFTK